MQKKLTITLDAAVYEGLYRVIGRRRISQFIESVIRPHVIGPGRIHDYQEMAADEAREAVALERAETTVRDVGDTLR